MPVRDRRSRCRARFTRVGLRRCSARWKGAARVDGAVPRVARLVRARGIARFAPCGGDAGQRPALPLSRALHAGWTTPLLCPVEGGGSGGWRRPPGSASREGGGASRVSPPAGAMPVRDRRSRCRARFTRVGLRRCSARWKGAARVDGAVPRDARPVRAGGSVSFALLRRAMPVGDRRSRCRAPSRRVGVDAIRNLLDRQKVTEVGGLRWENWATFPCSESETDSELAPPGVAEPAAERSVEVEEERARVAVEEVVGARQVEHLDDRLDGETVRQREAP